MRRHLIAALFVAVASGSDAHANITGFGGNAATGYTLNGGPTVSGPGDATDVLTLTTNSGSLNRSAFNNTAQSYQSGFTAQFTYQDVAGSGNADGAAFVLQNDVRGAAALGDSGGALGYGGGVNRITPSAALQLNIYNPNTIGTSFRTVGEVTTPFNTNSPVSVASGDPIAVTLNYNPATYRMTQTMLNTNTAATFTKTYPVILNAPLNNGATALVGFTGATGGETATQTITSYTYNTNSVTAAPIVLQDLFTATDGTPLSSHVPNVGNGGNSWNVPIGAPNINGGVINTTGAQRVANADFSSTLGPNQELIVSLHEYNHGGFFPASNLAGFYLYTDGGTNPVLVFGSPQTATSWSVATNSAGANLISSGVTDQNVDATLTYSYNTGAVALYVNDAQVLTGTFTAGLALNAFGFENNNGGDLIFDNLQVAIVNVPEPATLVMAGIAALGLARRRRT